MKSQSTVLETFASHFKDIYNSTSTLKLNWFFNLTEKFRKNGMLDNEDKIKITNCSFINDLIGQFSKNRDKLDPQDPNFDRKWKNCQLFYFLFKFVNEKKIQEQQIVKAVIKSSKAFFDNESENDNNNSSYLDSDSDSENILKYLFTSIENINDKFKGIEELISTSKTSTSKTSTSNRI
ncbi:hypothetical protein ACTFIR_012774 [Dictyostelium discoideum]